MHKSFDFKNMLIEDKISFIMEFLCYILSFGALMAIVFAIREGSFWGTVLLVISITGLISCGISTKKTRDKYL